MPKKLDAIQQVYVEVLNTVPYSSATPMFEIVGRPCASQYGGNCIRQNTSLQDRLRTLGFETTILRDRLHGRHHPILVVAEGATYYADIYLMSHKPINLTELLEGSKKTASFEAYPHLGEEKSRMTVSVDAAGKTFKVHKTWPGSNRIDEFEYAFASDSNRSPTDKEYKAIAFHPVQTTLSMRALNVAEARTDHILYSLKDKGEIDKNKLNILTNDRKRISFKSAQEFESALEVIAKHIGIPNENIIQFILQAVRYYHQLNE